MWGLQYLKMNAEEEIDDKEESSETTIDQTNIQSLPVIDFWDSDKDEESTDKHGSVSLEIEIDPTPKYYGYDTIVYHQKYLNMLNVSTKISVTKLRNLHVTITPLKNLLIALDPFQKQKKSLARKIFQNLNSLTFSMS